MIQTGHLITSSFKTDDGLNIFYRNWKVAGNPKGILLIVHGLNAHSGYYQDFALRLNENNFEVYAMDLRGRGRSEGERYFIADYRDVVDDINKLSNIIKTAYPDLPLFLYGHSAGGVFAGVYAVRYQQKLKGFISASFAYQIPAPGFALAIMKFLAYIIPHTRIIRINKAFFSRDPSAVETLNQDPLIADEKQPVKTMQQLILASAYLKKEMTSFRIPLFIIHGTDDKATLPAGSVYFMKHAGSSDKQLQLYNGYYHDLLHDKNHEVVIRDIVHWLNERTDKLRN